MGVLLLMAVSARAEFACVATLKANVREEPRGEVSWVADRYTPFRVLDRDGGWARISDVDGDEGWVHESVLGSGRCVIVSVARAKLRSGPAVRDEVIWKVERYYPFKVLQTMGPWVEVSDGGGVEGWVARDSVWGARGRYAVGES